jgi:hypothetical protein
VGGSVVAMASRDLEPQATVQPRSLIRAARSPSARRLVLCAAVVVTALATTAASQATPAVQLKSPSLADISHASRPIVDTTIAPSSTLGLVPPGYWGGEYTISSGEKVTVYASNSYPQDPALEQRWADFLGSLIHGPEISNVTVLLSTLGQLVGACGLDAIACYSPQGALLYTPGEDPAADLSAEAVITHEYGHHIAANRSDAPWNALAWGPKRWSSTIQVCARTRKNELVPGAEDPTHYAVNPGEGWAETYRLLNERKAGKAETPWDIVSQSLYPNDAALAAAEQDVVSPWAQSPATTHTLSFTRTARTRTVTVPTPLDGTLRLNLRASRGVRLNVDLYASSKRVVHVASASSVNRTATICSARSYRIRVKAVKGQGSARLTLSTP